MSTTKKTGKKEEVKRDLFDFIMDASQAGSAKGIKFLEELQKPGANAESLTKLLKEVLKYPGVRKKQVATLLDVYNGRPIIRNFLNSISHRSY